MNELFLSRLDFIYFFYGLGFLVLGGVSFKLAGRSLAGPPWFWLGLFGLCHGVVEWWDMLALILGEPVWSATVRNMLMFFSFAMLLEFGRRGLVELGLLSVGRWLAPVLLGAAALGGWLGGEGQIQPLVRYWVALPGCLTSALVMGMGRRTVGPARWWLGAAATAMVLYGLVGGATPPPSSLWPASQWNTVIFAQLTGLPIQLVRGLLAMALGLLLLAYGERAGGMPQLSRRRRRMLGVLVVLLAFPLAGGWFSLEVVERLTRDGLREEISSDLANLDNRIAREIYAADGAAMALAGQGPELLQGEELANRQVDRFAALVSHGVVYLMDREGQVVAASNRGRAGSFLGKNYRFRPYFREALAGRAGHYFAFGVTSNEPGYYASFPVLGRDGRVAGVAVVKKPLLADELGFNRYGHLFLADAHGVVLLSSHPEALLRPLWPLLPAWRKLLEESQQFGAHRFDQPPLFERPILAQDGLAWDKQRYLAGRQVINADDWSLLLLKEERATPLLRLFGIATTLLLACVLAAAFLLLRRDELVDDRLRKLSRAVEQSPAAVVITDRQAAIEYVNPAFCQISGYSLAEVIGQNPRFLQSGGTPASQYQEMWRTILAGQVWRGEFLNRKKDGDLFWESGVISPVSNEEGEITHFLGIKEDITARKLAEHALRESEARFRQLAELSPIGVYLTDTAGGYHYANQDWCRMAGLPPEAAMGDGWRAALHPEDRDRVVADWETWIASAGGRWEREFRFLTLDGEERWVWGLTAPLLDDAGHVNGFIGTTLDITDRKAMEGELLVAKENADAANRAKSAFLANMSHDIRTPMNSVLGMAELLLESPLDEEQQRLVRTLNTAGETLLALINDILDLSKIEAGQMTLESAPMALGELVGGVVELLGESARRKGIGLSCHVMPELPAWVLGDPVRLRQVLLNLVGNAVKFTSAGEVVVTVERPAGRSEYRIAVTDTGIGIPADKLGSIFQPFVQVDASTTRRFGGTGLGLAICHELVAAMGGTLQVASREGRGSRFHFTLPLVEASAPAATRPEFALVVGGVAPTPLPVANERRQGERTFDALAILLVDDAPDNRMLIEAFLKNTSHWLDIGENGAEAVGKCLARRYDLVLMDVQMPVMDGYTATRQVRAHEAAAKAPPMPIFALTAHAMKEDEQRSLQAGCSGHLTKPIRKRQLLELLERIVAQKQAGTA